MADARLLHKRGSHGERIVALSDFEHRVWVQYVLSADDYGVMRASPSVLRADNRRLEKAPAKAVQKAMDALVRCGLVSTFMDGGETYLWQIDWQDFQNVLYPRDTVMPAPPAGALSAATTQTRNLFSVHDLPSRERQKRLREFSRTVTETVSENSETVLAYTGARAHQTHTQPQTPSGVGSSEESARETVGAASSDGIPPVWGHRRHGALARTDTLIGGAHQRCDPATFAACSRGKCVPVKLAGEWRAQFAGDTEMAERVIRSTIDEAIAKLPPGPIGDEAWPFWNRVWSARHGSQAPASVKPGHRTMRTPVMVDWREECDRLHGGRCDSQYQHGLLMQRSAVSS